MRLALPDLLRRGPVPAAVPAAAALLGAVVAIAGGVRWVQADGRLEAARVGHEAASLLARGAERAGAPAAAAAAPRVRGRERSAPTEVVDTERVTLARFLAVDWNRRLLQVEQAGAGLVTLLGLRVDAQRGLVEMRGEVDSLERLETLRARLLESGVDAVQIQRHERVARPTGNRLAFVASAEWTR
ncbi:MAG: hypothetical protein ACK54X_08280 [Burkholderiales bacterium]